MTSPADEKEEHSEGLLLLLLLLENQFLEFFQTLQSSFLSCSTEEEDYKRTAVKQCYCCYYRYT